MNYRIFVSHEAEKVLDRLDRPSSVASGHGSFNLTTIRSIRDFRRHSPNAGVRKSRVGGWRILFTVDRDAMVVNVATVDTRGQVYKHS